MSSAILPAASLIFVAVFAEPSISFAIESTASQASAQPNSQDSSSNLKTDLDTLQKLINEKNSNKNLSSDEQDLLKNTVKDIQERLADATQQKPNYAHCYDKDNVQDILDAEKKSEKFKLPWGLDKYRTPITKFISGFRFGGDGVSTLQKDCFGDVAVTSNGATLSIQHDGILKKQTEVFKGAIGYTILSGASNNNSPSSDAPRANALPRLEIYARIDDENQITTLKTGVVKKEVVTYTQDVLETGLVIRGSSTKLNFLNPLFSRFGNSAADLPPELYTYIQPFYIKDEARNSELYGADVRFVPVAPRINVYDIPRDQNASDGGFYWGVIADARLDSAHFSLIGLPLAAPLKTSAPSSTVVGVPLELPNEDYVRVGGRIGLMTESYITDQFWSKVFGKGPYYFHFYYTDFSALDGVRHGFGEVSSQLSYPILPGLSLAATYLNGRSENIAAREESWSLAVKFGGAP